MPWLAPFTGAAGHGHRTTTNLLPCVAFMTSRPFTALALASSIFVAIPVAAAGPSESDVLEPIGWGDAPGYIQEQARNVVMHCSEGEYTPNQVRFLRHRSASAPDAVQFVLDFSAMRGLTHQLPGCNYNSPVCGPAGCFLMAYTQMADGGWDQTWFGSALSWKTTAITVAGMELPAIEVTQAAPSCTLVNGGHGSCPAQFTWIGGKFKFFGMAGLSIGEGTSGIGRPPEVTPVLKAPMEPAASQEEPVN